MQRRRGSNNTSGSNTTKRSRRPASQVMREACAATVERLENRQLLSGNVGINFVGGYNGNPSALPWSLKPNEQAGVPSITLGSGSSTYTVSGAQPNWNNAGDTNVANGTLAGLVDQSGTTIPVTAYHGDGMRGL